MWVVASMSGNRNLEKYLLKSEEKQTHQINLRLECRAILKQNQENQTYVES